MSKSIYQYACRLLSVRDYSRYGLGQKLLRRKFDSNGIEKVLDILIEDKLLNEKNYIVMRSRNFLRKGYAARMVVQLLQKEHLIVELKLIEEIMFEMNLTHEKQIEEIVEKRRRSVDPKWEIKTKKYLYQRGHSVENIRELQ